MIRNYAKPFLLFGLLLLLTLAFGVPANARAASVITDTAKILTLEETQELIKNCKIIEQQSDTSVFIVTSDTIGMHDDFEGYMESIGNDTTAPENLVLLFVSVKEGDRVFQIFGYGKAETFMNADRCNAVMDLMQNDMSNGNYFRAFRTFCEEVQLYMGKDPRFDSLIFHPLVHLIAALLLSALIIFCMVHSNIGKNTTTVKTYIDNSHSRLLGRIDHFTHMTVKRVKKSSSGGSGGRSGGGRSHSSGRARSF